MRDLADFWDFYENFKAKTNMEDEGISKKGKMVIFMIFVPPHHRIWVKRYSKLLLCEANATIYRTDYSVSGQNKIGRELTLLALIQLADD